MSDEYLKLHQLVADFFATGEALDRSFGERLCAKLPRDMGFAEAKEFVDKMEREGIQARSAHAQAHQALSRWNASHPKTWP